MSDIIVPDGWEYKEMGEILELIRNGWSGKQVDYITESPITRIETIATGEIDYSKIGYVEEIESTYKLQKDDILISNINSVKHIGKIAIYKEEKILYHGMNLLLLRFSNSYDRTLLYYQLLFKKPWFERMCSQAVNQASINQTTTKRCPLIIPKDINEQQKIAAILQSADNNIKKTKELIAKHERIKEGLMQDLFTKGIDENGNIRSEETHKFRNSPLGRIPEEWKVLELGDTEYFELKTGGTPSTEVPAYWNGEIPWLSSGEVHKERIYETERTITQLGYNRSNATYIPPKSTLIALAGQGKTRGTAAITEIKLTTNQSVAAIVPIPNDDLVGPYYLYFYMDSQYWNLRSSSAGAGRAGLSLSILSKYQILLPKIHEQIKIAKTFNRLDFAIQSNYDDLQKLKKIKAGLMQDLLTGKVRVNHLIEHEAVANA